MDTGILFEARNIGKQYPGTLALQGVDMEVRAGEVVGLIGENGAGKSTLLKIITGVEQPTEGAMRMGGRPYAPEDPIQANRMGVGMVFQEQSLIRNLTVAQNVFLGLEKRYSKMGFVNWKKLNRDTAEVLASIGIKNIPPGKKVSLLDFATRQMVEIAKVFHVVKNKSGSASMILLDEPTSVLNDSEVETLFAQIDRMRKEGNAVIFVSHRLDEVLRISDRIYIFKDGRNVGMVNREEADEQMLYAKMVGRTTTGEYFKVDKQSVPQEEVVLEVKNLGLRGYFKDVSFKLHRGEILGICGVVGSGKESLCSVIAGDETHTSGELFLKGVKKCFSSPYEALKSGVLSIPKERRDEGIVGILSVLENISLSSYKTLKRHLFISRKRQAAQADEWVKKLEIKCSGIKNKLNQLSGGNAQKVVFARVLSSGADLLILNHPTRGVDVGAKEDIYEIVREITAMGKSVILLGDTLDECIGLSNRIIVMKDGVVTGAFDASPENKPEQLDIVKYMM